VLSCALVVGEAPTPVSLAFSHHGCEDMASRKKTRQGASASGRNGRRTRARAAAPSASATRRSRRSPAR